MSSVFDRDNRLSDWARDLLMGGPAIFRQQARRQGKVEEMERERLDFIRNNPNATTITFKANGEIIVEKPVKGRRIS